MKVISLMNGFPGKSSRGWLGWSSVVLVTDGKRNVLFDTGSCNDRPVMLQRLTNLGLSPEQIDWVVLSHLHFDHISNVDLFPYAKIALHIKELEHVQSAVEKDLAVPACYVDYLRNSGRLTLIKAEQELFPDWQVIETPGHTPGSISLKLMIDNHCYILAGDAVKSRFELKSGQVEVAFDKELATQSLLRIRKEADIIIPGHDLNLSFCDGVVKPMSEADNWVQVSGGSQTRYVLNSDETYKGDKV